MVAGLIAMAAGDAWAAEPTAGTTWTDPSSGIEFVWVPSGHYQMGCGPWAEPCGEIEKPAHAREIAGFWMGKTEVTQAQWKRVLGDNPAKYQKGDGYPVDQTTWFLVEEMLKALNSHGNGHFRLPSEAEWEYACRAGGEPDRYCGGNAHEPVAWYLANTRFSTMPVGGKTPNRFGLYDMSGNLYEWVADCWHDNYVGAPTDGRAWTGGECEAHVLRGGSWGNSPAQLRSTARRSDTDVKCNFVGVRLVRSSP